MGRRVEDVHLGYQQICGRDPRDPQWVPVPAMLPVPDRLRVAVTTDPAAGGVHPAVSAAIGRAADALAEAGAIVELVEPPHIEEAAHLWRTLTTAEMHDLLKTLVQPLGSAGAATYFADSLAHVPVLDLAGYVAGMARRHAIAAAWSRFFNEYHLVLGPVSTQPTHSVDFDLGGPDNTDTLWHSHRLVLTLNLLGLPALVVPAGTDNDGLPQAVQLIGGRYQESTCLRAGQLIEQALGTLTPITPR